MKITKSQLKQIIEEEISEMQADPVAMAHTNSQVISKLQEALGALIGDLRGLRRRVKKLEKGGAPISEQVSITELESWATEELEPVINQVLQRLGVVEKNLKIDPSTAVIKEELASDHPVQMAHINFLSGEITKIKERLKTLERES